jgi:serine/threonine-protein kinase
MPLLVVEKGHDKGKAIPLQPKGTALIGRDSSTAFPLHDTMASRMHCKIEAREDGYYLHDLESMNGTYLNGSKIKEPAKLTFGDLIKVGETLFTFQSDDSSATTLSGQRVGGYRIVERLGRGGMGTVYKAEQIDLQRMVALKVISEEHTKDEDFVELFVHEARAAAKLNHPNVVQVYDVKRHGDIYYFSMEYVSGGSVQDVLNKQRKIGVDQTVQWILDAARGLDYAHKKGIVHRDVKPDNLMISETGMVKIGDMGLARGLNEKVGPEEETSVIGTPHYIAPEQVLGRPADFRCDIYSLGATAYRMLAGVTPFQAPSVRDLVNKKVREDAPPAHDFNSEVPKALSEIVGRMMARDPERRYQTMAEVAADLERFQRGQADAAAEARREHSTAVEMLVGNKKLLVGAVVLLIVVVVGGVAGALWIKDHGNPAPGPHTTRAVDPERARQALEIVQLTELRKMDRTDPRSIERVIEDYGKVAEEYGGTEAGKKAVELRVSLEKLLREVKADERLKRLEAEDVIQYRQITPGVAARKVDLDPAEAARAAYESFARSPEAKGTPAGIKAAERADHLTRWKAEVERQRGDYEAALRRAREACEQGRFRDAWTTLTEFQEAAKRAELDCDFARDRWRALFYDEIAAQEAQDVTREARMAWVRMEEQVRSLARDKNYDAAIKLLDTVIADSVPEVVQMARPVKEFYEVEAATILRREKEAEAAAKAQAVAKARADYAGVSKAVRDLVLKHDYKAALQKMRHLRDDNQVEEFKERLDRRAAELERAARLKETLLKVINGQTVSSTAPKFKREYTTPTGDGLIEGADDKSLKIRLSGGFGGQYERGWGEMTGAEFYEFAKKHWKYSKDVDGDANDKCDLAAVCMEFGLYEEALAELEGALTIMKSPLYPITDSRRFCEEYLTRLAKGDSAELGDIEAQKRLARLEAFMKAGDLEKAQKEIDLLKGQYLRTPAVIQAQSKIDEYILEIQKRGGEQFNRARREERFQKMQAKVAEDQANARKAQPDIVQRLGRVDDLFARNVHLAAVYAAAGEWRLSTDKYLEARRLADGMISRREVGREFLPLVGFVYGELFRNYVMLKDRKNAELVKNDGARRFVNPDTKTEEDWWARTMGYLATWSEQYLPVEEKRIVRLREELRASPDDPNKIWALAVTSAEALQNLMEARGYFLYLLEHHPEFSQVANGNCLYRLAEIHYAFREVREAIRRYRELGEQYKEHPKVQDSNAESGVRRRLDDCYKLLNKMGYPRDKQR